MWHHACCTGWFRVSSVSQSSPCEKLLIILCTKHGAICSGPSIECFWGSADCVNVLAPDLSVFEHCNQLLRQKQTLITQLYTQLALDGRASVTQEVKLQSVCVQ